MSAEKPGKQEINGHEIRVAKEKGVCPRCQKKFDRKLIKGKGSKCIYISLDGLTYRYQCTCLKGAMFYEWRDERGRDKKK